MNPSDFCVFVCLMLPRLGETVLIAPLLLMILDCDFFSSKLIILGLNGLPPSVNVICCHVLQALVSLDPSLLYIVLEKLSLWLILTTEHLIQLSDRFQALFFVD
jgi:hypothetical protein